MHDFREKQKVRRFLYSKVTVGALAILVLFVGFKTWGIYQKERLSREMLEEAKATHADLSMRALALSNDIERLNTDIGFEEVVRDRYGVARKGENVVVLLDADDTGATEENEEEGFWEKVKEFFGVE